MVQEYASGREKDRGRARANRPTSRRGESQTAVMKPQALEQAIKKKEKEKKEKKTSSAVKSCSNNYNHNLFPLCFQT